MIRLINIFLLGLVFFSCKEIAEKKTNNPLKQQVVVQDSIKNETPINDSPAKDEKLNINGVWVCYKYISDNRSEKKYGDDFAQEISNFSKFEINNNKLQIGNCNRNIYTYKYATKLKKYDDESLFISYLKPKQDTVTFIGAINSGNNQDCDIIDNFTLYVIDNENIIQNDRGYFFYYKKLKNNKQNTDFDIKGIPGNNRNEWNIKWKLNNLSTVDQGYDYFKTHFPYGAKNLSEVFPNSNEFLDKKNGITYFRKNEELKVVKDDPMGKINLSIIQNKNKTISFVYELEYPDYD